MATTPREEIDRLKAAQGWDLDSQLLLAERFIEERKEEEAFLLFLSAVAEDENGGEDDDDDDEESLLDIEYKCPSCKHEWSEEWTSACDSECPECGLGSVMPVSWKEAADD